MLNVSIVLYNHTFAEIETLVNSTLESSLVKTIFLIDNSPVMNAEFRRLEAVYIFNGKNLGYGAAHNIALRRTIQDQVPYHLVVNPDIQFDSKILSELMEFMEANKDVGDVMPKTLYPDGEIQYLCKLLPKPTDLIFRRFLPPKWVANSNATFELRASGYDKIMEAPYLSGCFMFLRTKALENSGLFDERFFLYPEDIDLTRRIHRTYKTIFYPHVHIIHRHQRGSYQNAKLLWIHLTNLIRYFNKWGWFFDAERKKVNDEIFRKLNLL